MPSDAAASNSWTLSERSVYDAGAIIASFGIFGVIWLDRNLNVVHTYGQLVDFVTCGQPVTDSVLAIIGLESEITSLADHPDRMIELPAVAVADPLGHPKRLNFTFFWNSDRCCPVALAYRSSSQTELEMELSKQIRARLMAEAEVTAKSKELARANSDLESFAAIVSHDLKAPLRHMQGMAQSAAEEAESRGDASLKTTLAEIQVHAQRMSQMLSALLDYSTLGRKYEALESVDTRALIQSIKTSLPRGGIHIAIEGDWPAVTTLRAPLDLVLRNLIGNALQHHDRVAGQIRVICDDSLHALTFTVSDDGPGIDARHHAAIFLPFRTLQSDGVSTSSGMGLAMVKKAVESAGGSIVLVSNPALRRGTAFTVTWPKYLDI
jgi:signal transduction histidine kinase